jgi:hypothetical protein
MANCPCSGSVCSTTSLQAPQQVTLCTEQIMEEDCSLVVENQVPSYCLPFTTED